MRALRLLPLFIALLLVGCGSLPSPRRPYDATAYRPKDPNNVRVKVSLQNRMVYVMEGSRPLLVTPTAIGKPGHETPKGQFKVQKKIAKKRSYSYGYWTRGSTIVPGKSSQPPPGGGWRYKGYPMAYWVEFLPAYGFHEGAVWPTPRTHGCLRLHKNVAPKFFHLVKIGTPVIILRSQPEDLTVGRNVPRPTDYADPDPPSSYMISDRVFTPLEGPLFEEG